MNTQLPPYVLLYTTSYTTTTTRTIYSLHKAQKIQDLCVESPTTTSRGCFATFVFDFVGVAN